MRDIITPAEHIFQYSNVDLAKKSRKSKESFVNEDPGLVVKYGIQ